MPRKALAILPALLLSTTRFFESEPSARLHDPRTEPVTISDALYSIPDVTGSIVLTRDCDGDGVPDIAVGRGGTWPRPETVDLISSRTGAWIGRLGPLPAIDCRAGTWDVTGDLDGDNYPDLLVGDPSMNDHAGCALLISGRRGALIAAAHGGRPYERFGSSVTFLGDVNGDGLDDFAVGAGEYDAERRPALPEIKLYGADGENRYVFFADGSRMTEQELAEEYLRARSEGPGFVSVRSGRDRSELWRVCGSTSGHAFGSHLAAAGDLDRDGKADLLVQSDLRSSDPVVVLSSSSGREILRVAHKHGFVGPAGDLDGDKAPDLFVDNEDVTRSGRVGSVQFISSVGGRKLFDLTYPDMWSEYGATVAMGDLDDDGYDDVALGDGNFNLCRPGDPSFQRISAVDLSKLSLVEALQLESNPWCAFTWESGCALVYSGRTHKPIFGVWGEPGTRAGIGVGVGRLPDISGDGFPDVLVASGSTAYAFRGPGAAPK